MSYEYLLTRTLQTSYFIYPTNQDCKGACRFGAHNAKYPPSILSRVTGGYFPGDKATGTWIWPLTSICLVPSLTIHAVTHTFTYMASWLGASFSTSAVAFALDMGLQTRFHLPLILTYFCSKIHRNIIMSRNFNVSSDFHEGSYTYFCFFALAIVD
jgi:hypothetical protein